jgi:hypothetical protein
MNAEFTKRALHLTLASVIALGLIATVSSAHASSTHRMSLSITTQGSTRLEGTVSAISGSTISVSSWLGTWTANAGSAKFLPEGSITLSGIKTGDQVVIRGAITNGMVINATAVTDLTTNTFAAPAMKVSPLARGDSIIKAIMSFKGFFRHD